MPKPLTDTQLASISSWSSLNLLWRFERTATVKVLMAMQHASGVGHKGPGDPDIDQMLVEYAALRGELLNRIGMPHKKLLNDFEQAAQVMAVHAAAGARGITTPRLTDEQLITTRAVRQAALDMLLPRVTG